MMRIKTKKYRVEIQIGVNAKRKSRKNLAEEEIKFSWLKRFSRKKLKYFAVKMREMFPVFSPD
jgi:hypothetical protein